MNGLRAHGHKGLTRPQQQALVAASLWIVYHIECERFDAGVCTGGPAPDGSGRMPRTATETGIIVAHASKVGEALVERAQRLGLTKPVVEAAERFVQAMPYAQVQHDYATALRLIGGPLDA